MGQGSAGGPKIWGPGANTPGHPDYLITEDFERKFGPINVIPSEPYLPPEEPSPSVRSKPERRFGFLAIAGMIIIPLLGYEWAGYYLNIQSVWQYVLLLGAIGLAVLVLYWLRRVIKWTLIVGFGLLALYACLQWVAHSHAHP